VDKSGESAEGKLGVWGESAEEEAFGEGVGVVSLDDSKSSCGIDSKGFGGLDDDDDMVRTRMG